MKFDELDARMRVFETAHDHCVLPGLQIVARLDGRNFTRLTKETWDFEKPFDVRFRDFMVETTRHLKECGYREDYGKTQSDDNSLLHDRDEVAFGRKERKLNSILASEAGAKFSLLVGALATFDCRVCQLPTLDDVRDYFRWRSEDAHRNALNGHCYWRLRAEGLGARAATKALIGLSVAQKNELLFQRGINFNDLPGWQKRGVGLHWETYQKEARNPKTGETVFATRRRIAVVTDLPMRDAYDAFILGLVGDAAR
jgi:tRNA(His) 5'-end guanylyltransferase